MRITLVAVQSLDGFITRHDQPGSGFASKADQAHLRAALAGFDCSIMGAETYRTSRDWIRNRMTAPRRRVILSRSPGAFAADAVPGVLEFSAAQPQELVASLHAAGHRHCALLGGAQIHGLFLEAGLVDELWLTLEPVLFGGGTPLVAKKIDAQCELLSSEKLNAHTLLLKYGVLR